MNFDAILFDAAETLFTTRGSVGEIYALLPAIGSMAPASEIQAAFASHFPHSGPLNSATRNSGGKTWYSASSKTSEWWRTSTIFRRSVRSIPRFARMDALSGNRPVLEEPTASSPETRRHLQFRFATLLGAEGSADSHFFNSITICSEIGYAKPHPEIFRAALRTLGVTPTRTLFTGDSLVDDFQAGEGAGLATYLLDRSGRYAAMRSVRRISSLREILKIVGIAPNS